MNHLIPEPRRNLLVSQNSSNLIFTNEQLKRTGLQEKDIISSHATMKKEGGESEKEKFHISLVVAGHVDAGALWTVLYEKVASVSSCNACRSELTYLLFSSNHFNILYYVIIQASRRLLVILYSIWEEFRIAKCVNFKQRLTIKANRPLGSPIIWIRTRKNVNEA